MKMSLNQEEISIKLISEFQLHTLKFFIQDLTHALTALKFYVVHFLSNTQR